MGVVVSHQFDSMTHRDIMLFHKASNLRVGFNLPSSFRSLSPGGVVSRGSPFSSFPRVSSVFGQVASLLVADEAFAVSDMLRSFTRRKIDFVYVHSVGVGVRSPVSWWNITVFPFSELPKSYHIAVKLSCLVKPLFLLPPGLLLPIREGSGSHHDGKLLGYSSLEGV